LTQAQWYHDIAIIFLRCISLRSTNIMDKKLTFLA
jgi:hypothetical protein